MLLTASRKGDVQYVWDLMRITHGKGDTAGMQELINQPGASSEPQGPLVRQVARFARMTVASIIDVVWSAPRGDRLALVTENGTAHVFELPQSAFAWPPLRRSIRPVTAPGSATSRETDDELAIGDKPATNAFTSAINMMNGKAQPLLAAVRNRPLASIFLFCYRRLGVTSAVGAAKRLQPVSVSQLVPPQELSKRCVTLERTDCIFRVQYTIVQQEVYAG
jgi:hypothetical protein